MNTLPDASVAYVVHWGVVKPEYRRRGEETALGEAGYCGWCGVFAGEGPDPCLGYLDGVSHACCGHGDVERAYVVLGGEPNQWVGTIANPEVLRGALALRYFGLIP